MVATVCSFVPVVMTPYQPRRGQLHGGQPLTFRFQVASDSTNFNVTRFC